MQSTSQNGPRAQHCQQQQQDCRRRLLPSRTPPHRRLGWLQPPEAAAASGCLTATLSSHQQLPRLLQRVGQPLASACLPPQHHLQPQQLQQGPLAQSISRQSSSSGWICRCRGQVAVRSAAAHHQPETPQGNPAAAEASVPAAADGRRRRRIRSAGGSSGSIVADSSSGVADSSFADVATTDSAANVARGGSSSSYGGTSSSPRGACSDDTNSDDTSTSSSSSSVAGASEPGSRRPVRRDGPRKGSPVRSRFRIAGSKSSSSGGSGSSRARSPEHWARHMDAQSQPAAAAADPATQPAAAAWYGSSSSSPAASSSSSRQAPAAPRAQQQPAARGAGSSDVPLSRQLLSEQQVGQLQSYLAHMLEVNKVMNLTAIRDPGEAWERHIEDSLALLPVIDKHVASNATLDDSHSGDTTAGALSVIDVGTGAGLPGVVLAVARPQWKVTLLDSLKKRCDFLTATAELLGLSNVEVVWCRAEEGGLKPALRERHGLAVARAVAELRVLAELCLPFVAPGGAWVAAKGAHPQAEVAAAVPALSKLGGRLLAVEPVASWAPEGQRTAVVVAKTGPTPDKYPRAPGTPNKKPL